MLGVGEGQVEVSEGEAGGDGNGDGDGDGWVGRGPCAARHVFHCHAPLLDGWVACRSHNCQMYSGSPNSKVASWQIGCDRVSKLRPKG